MKFLMMHYVVLAINLSPFCNSFMYLFEILPIVFKLSFRMTYDSKKNTRYHFGVMSIMK